MLQNTINPCEKIYTLATCSFPVRSRHLLSGGGSRSNWWSPVRLFCVSAAVQFFAVFSPSFGNSYCVCDFLSWCWLDAVQSRLKFLWLTSSSERGASYCIYSLAFSKSSHNSSSCLCLSNRNCLCTKAFDSLYIAGSLCFACHFSLIKLKSVCCWCVDGKFSLSLSFIIFWALSRKNALRNPGFSDVAPFKANCRLSYISTFAQPFWPIFKKFGENVHTLVYRTQWLQHSPFSLVIKQTFHQHINNRHRGLVCKTVANLQSAGSSSKELTAQCSQL